MLREGNDDRFPDDDLLNSFTEDESGSIETTSSFYVNNGLRNRISKSDKIKNRGVDKNTHSNENDQYRNHIDQQFDSTVVYSWFSAFGEKAKDTLKSILIEEEDIHLSRDTNNSADYNEDYDDGDVSNFESKGNMYETTHDDSQHQQHLSISNNDGVGLFYIHLISASKTEVNDTAEGDHYAIVAMEEFDTGSWTYTYPSANNTTNNDSSSYYQEFKTQTVRSSSSPVFNKKWVLNVPTYQSCLKIILFNSHDHTIIGVSKISVYSLIVGKHGDGQMKRIPKGPSFDSDNKTITLTKTINESTTTTSRSSAEYVEDVKMRDPSDPSKITGSFIVAVSFVENIQELFKAKKPRLIKGPDEETLSVERLVKHINRFQALINLVGDIFQEYDNLMNWKDSIFTFLIFLLFIFTTIRISSEYALCCPLFLLVVLFTRAWLRRSSGVYTKELIERVKKNSVPHRPMGLLRLSVVDMKYCKDPTLISQSADDDTKSRSKLSSFWGQSTTSKSVRFQKPFVRISFRTMKGDFTKMKKGSNDNERREFLIGMIGYPEAAEYSKSNMTNNGIIAKDSFIHNVMDPWPESPFKSNTNTNSSNSSISFTFNNVFRGGNSSSHNTQEKNLKKSTEEELPMSLIYPILQPLWKNVSQSFIGSTEHSSEILKKRPPTVGFVPWTENDSEIVFTFYSEKPSNGLLDKFINTSEIGSFAVLLKDVAAAADPHQQPNPNSNPIIDNDVFQWFPVIPSLKKDKLRSDYNDLGLLEPSIIGSSDQYNHSSLSSYEYNDRTLWVKIKIRFEVPRSSSGSNYSEDEINCSLSLFQMLNETEPKKNTISTIFSLRDTVEIVQNIMSVILNYIEKIKNIFLWVSPDKTYPLFVGLIIIWLATILIPGRYLILVIGLYQFLFKFIPEPEEKPMSIKIKNFINSIPNDDDIDKVYQWERKEYAEKLDALKAQQLRQAKLNLFAPVLWKGSVHVKCAEQNNWEKSYLIFHSKRLVWWQREADIDEGKPFAGSLILHGHAGVTQASLVDVRETNVNEDQMIAIFGRDCQGHPIKCTIFCQDSLSCGELEKQVKLTCMNL